jgi:hypothetical protein
MRVYVCPLISSAASARASQQAHVTIYLIVTFCGIPFLSFDPHSLAHSGGAAAVCVCVCSQIIHSRGAALNKDQGAGAGWLK